MNVFKVIGFAALCVVLIIGGAKVVFSYQTQAIREGLSPHASDSAAQVVTEDRIKDLPKPVQRWISKAGVIGRSSVNKVHMNQEGQMRLGADKPWMPFEATQLFNAQSHEFVWETKVKMFPLLDVLGRDVLSGGHGSMNIKLLGLIGVVDATGPEIDQGSMVRYLAETIWFPSAALSDDIKWTSDSSNAATATLTIGELTVAADFHFSEAGDVKEIFAQRWMAQDEDYSMETWHIIVDRVDEFSGYRIPSSARVIWEFEQGPYEWLRIEINEVEFE